MLEILDWTSSEYRNLYKTEHYREAVLNYIWSLGPCGNQEGVQSEMWKLRSVWESQGGESQFQLQINRMLWEIKHLVNANVFKQGFHGVRLDLWVKLE